MRILRGAVQQLTGAAVASTQGVELWTMQAPVLAGMHIFGSFGTLEAAGWVVNLTLMQSGMQPRFGLLQSVAIFPTCHCLIRAVHAAARSDLSELWVQGSGCTSIAGAGMAVPAPWWPPCWAGCTACPAATRCGTRRCDLGFSFRLHFLVGCRAAVPSLCTALLSHTAHSYASCTWIRLQGDRKQ